ncbi:MAG: hypothetical protein ABG776_13910 [Cyanobacteria bacterium J06555_13]
MSLVISDDFLHKAHISATDLKLEIATLLFSQGKLALDAASQFTGIQESELKSLLNNRRMPSQQEQTSDDKTGPNKRKLETDLTGLSQAEILEHIDADRTCFSHSAGQPDSLTLLQKDRAR